MITRQKGESLLHKHAVNVFCMPNTSWSWFRQIADICLLYQLNHLLNYLDSPMSKEAFMKQVKCQMLDYWNQALRGDANELSSLCYFKPQFMSLSKPHPLITTPGSSPYEVSKAVVQATFLSGRYRTERLCRHWSSNKEGYCLLTQCINYNHVEDLQHIFLHCVSLSEARCRLVNFTLAYVQKVEILQIIRHL